MRSTGPTRLRGGFAGRKARVGAQSPPFFLQPGHGDHGHRKAEQTLDRSRFGSGGCAAGEG